MTAGIAPRRRITYSWIPEVKSLSWSFSSDRTVRARRVTNVESIRDDSRRDKVSRRKSRLSCKSRQVYQMHWAEMGQKGRSFGAYSDSDRSFGMSWRVATRALRARNSSFCNSG